MTESSDDSQNPTKTTNSQMHTMHTNQNENKDDRSKDDRHRLAARLQEAGIDTENRFIPVESGGKASTVAHHHSSNRYDETGVTGNYGVYAGGGLVDVDIDDYGDDTDADALAAVLDLPETLTIQSPHTDGDTGGHRYYHVETPEGMDVGDVIESDLGIKNPRPTWGEIRVSNQYVVGPGSQLDGCSKTGCDRCDDPDGGFYTIAADEPVASIGVDTFLDVIKCDPKYDPDADTDEDEGDTGDEDVEVPEFTVDTRLESALSTDEKLRTLWNGDCSGYGGDRSRAESALAAKLSWWFGGDRHLVERLMDSNPHLEKWGERTDTAYRESVLDAVDLPSDYYTARPADSDEGDEDEDGSRSPSRSEWNHPRCPRDGSVLDDDTIAGYTGKRRECPECEEVWRHNQMIHREPKSNLEGVDTLGGGSVVGDGGEADD